MQIVKYKLRPFAGSVQVFSYEQMINLMKNCIRIMKRICDIW